MTKKRKIPEENTPRLPSFEDFNIGNTGTTGSYGGIGVKGNAPFLSFDRLPPYYAYINQGSRI